MPTIATKDGVEIFYKDRHGQPLYPLVATHCNSQRTAQRPR